VRHLEHHARHLETADGERPRAQRDVDRGRVEKGARAEARIVVDADVREPDPDRPPRRTDVADAQRPLEQALATGEQLVAMRIHEGAEVERGEGGERERRARDDHQDRERDPHRAQRFRNRRSRSDRAPPARFAAPAADVPGTGAAAAGGASSMIAK